MEVRADRQEANDKTNAFISYLSLLTSHRRRSVFTRDTQHFLHAGFAGQHALAAVSADARSLGAGIGFEILFAGAIVDVPAHVFVHVHQLVNAGAAPVAGLVAGIATLATMEA